MVDKIVIAPEWQVLHDAATAAKDTSYADFVCRFPASFYHERIRRIGFWGHENVLDVGCGYGQWIAALCVENGHVTGLERHAGRLAITRKHLATRGLSNWSLVEGDAQRLPFADASFDALLCYGVFMFLDRAQAVREFQRVLRPGGRLYVCTNARGWWLKLWLQNLWKNASVRRSAWRGIVSGRNATSLNATSRRDVPRLLTATEWESVDAELEGFAAQSPGEPALPAYPGTFLNIDSVIEFVATRRFDPAALSRGANRRAAVESRIEQVVAQTLAIQEISFPDRLARHPQPRPALDLVNNCDRHAVRRAAMEAASVDRSQVLKKIFQTVTRDCTTDEERVVAAVRFVQLRFFHHFAGQPTKAPDQLLTDPIAALLLGEGRCGTQARFLVDLFHAAGWSARLLGGSCHTAAEIRLADRWVIADANLFPAGVLPRNDRNELLSIDEAAAVTWLLDRTPSYINYHHEYVSEFLECYPETDFLIGDFLRAPLLPSAGYFGGDTLPAIDGSPGKVVRFEKTGDSRRWATDADFGWRKVKTVDPFTGPVSQWIRRPGQPRNLRIFEGRLTWDAGFCPPEYAVGYAVTVNDQPRGWSYRVLQVDCTFAVPGSTVQTNETSMVLADLPTGAHATVRAVARDRDERVFYLPSVEISLV